MGIAEEETRVDGEHRSLRQRLKQLLGSEFVFDEHHTLRHLSVDGIQPRMVAAPADAEEMAKLVQFLAGESLTMTVRGGGTGLGQGHPPTRLDVLILTSRLDQTEPPDPQTLTVTAGAGIRLDEFEHRLAPSGLCLPINPPATDLATLGGVIACNASGPRRLRHGTMLDLCKEITLVNSRGEIVTTQPAPPPGLDATRLVIGSLGTLGVIVAATVRLKPRPEKLQALLASFSALAPALAAADALLALGETPAFLELVAPEAVRRMNPLPEGVALPQDKFVLAVAAEGGKIRVKELIEAERGCLSKAGAETIADLDHGIEWELDYILQELYAEHEGILVQVSLPRSRLGEFLDRVPTLNGLPGLRLGRMAHAGMGLAHLVLQPERDLAWPEELPQVMSRVRELVAKLSGRARLLNAPTELKAKLPALDRDPVEDQGRDRLRQEWDPNHLFTPGRLAS
jgi:glycolate oxidase FAD binding subunit